MNSEFFTRTVYASLLWRLGRNGVATGDFTATFKEGSGTMSPETSKSTYLECLLLTAVGCSELDVSLFQLKFGVLSSAASGTGTCWPGAPNKSDCKLGPYLLLNFL